MRVEMDVQEKTKTVYFWLTNEDQRNEGLQQKLKDMYRDYQAKGYISVVFRSGQEDLMSLTRDLLLYNKTMIAQMSAQKEKQVCVKPG